MQDRPLSGVRVLDLTNVLAGPYCSYQLMLLGAEVVKVEVPGRGDLARHLGPDPELNAAGIGASFLAQNAGKKSVELDLKDAAGRATFEELHRAAPTCCWRTSAPGCWPAWGSAGRGCTELNPAAGLLRDLRLRADGPDEPGARLRPDHPGPVRDDEHHRHRRRRPRCASASRSATRSAG